MRSLPLRSIWQIVSEINLAEIQREIETPFHLLIAADEEADAEEAARSISAPGADFTHPWLTVTDSAGSAFHSQSTEVVPYSPESHAPSSQEAPPSIDGALLVTTRLELSPDLAALLRMLRSNSIPVLIVLTGSEGKRSGCEIARLENRFGSRFRIGPMMRSTAWLALSSKSSLLPYVCRWPGVSLRCAWRLATCSSRRHRKQTPVTRSPPAWVRPCRGWDSY